MLSKRILFTSLIISSLLFLSSCGEKEDDKLGDAQACLDKATSATAMSCIEKINDLDSSGAHTLKCAAYFIAEGFDTPEKYSQIFDKIKKQPAGCNSCSTTMGVVDVLAFGSAGVSSNEAIELNLKNSEIALNHCSKSGSKSYALISTLAQVSTVINMTLHKYGTGDIQSSINSIINGGASDIATPADIGNIASVAYQTTCTTGEQGKESTSIKSVCDELSVAINSGSSATDVGNCILNKWKDKNYVCP